MSVKRWLPWMALLAACGGGPGGTPGAPPAFGEVQSGDGTYYAATGDGACSYGPSPQDLMVAGMNAPQYQNSSACGMCAEVTGPKGKILVRIVDLCPECKAGDLDLSREAFARIADPVAGRVKISWQAVACPVTGPLSFSFSAGSSQFWMAVQVRSSRYPIRQIELLRGDSFAPLKQESYNYYVQSSSPGPAPGPGPFTFRVTAVTGAQLVEAGVPLAPGAVVPGTQQF